MDLLTADLRKLLRANAERRHEAYRTRRSEPDPVPVVKLFNPVGAATWLATELDGDGDTLFGSLTSGLAVPNSAHSRSARLRHCACHSVSASNAIWISWGACRCRSGPIPRAAQARSSPPSN